MTSGINSRFAYLLLVGAPVIGLFVWLLGAQAGHFFSGLRAASF